MEHLTFEEAAALEADVKPLLGKSFLFKKANTQLARLIQVDMVIRGDGYDLLFSFDNSRKLSAKDFVSLNKPKLTFSILSQQGLEKLSGAVNS